MKQINSGVNIYLQVVTMRKNKDGECETCSALRGQERPLWRSGRRLGPEGVERISFRKHMGSTLQAEGRVWEPREGPRARMQAKGGPCQRGNMAQGELAGAGRGHAVSEYFYFECKEKPETDIV